MITSVHGPGAATVWLALCCLAGMAHGQTTVAGGEDRLVVDGAFVRLESPDSVSEISGGWRTAGGASTADVGALLATLGAIEADDHLRITVAGDILFDFGSSEITEASRRVLAEVAQVIRDRARGEILVVGHTDAVGDAEANLRLSRERAASVIRWLHHTEGIPARLLVGYGMGEARPVADNTTPDGGDDPAGRARNRRVELWVATTATADVRAAASLTVRSGAAEIHLQKDRVEVGEVVVDRDGVRVGDLAVGVGGGIALGSGSRAVVEGRFTCPAGQRCDTDCPEGDCIMTCSPGATCDFACSGGDCRMVCAADAGCRFGCAGGDCHFTCAAGSSCSTSCTGEDCTEG